LGCGSSAHPLGPVSTRPYRILFIGNSLTYVNDLPGMLAGLARSVEDRRPIETESVAYPNFALEDHLAQGDAARAIRKGGWDVVVLQQGPSSLPESRANLVEYSKRFAVLIRAVGARPAMYGVWPEAARIQVIDDCIESYRVAADSIDGLLFPAAKSWKSAWQIDPSLPLYGPDAFHPSVLGTYAAAATMLAVVLERSPVGWPGTFQTPGGIVTLDSIQVRGVQLGVQSALGTSASATMESRSRRP
jgi:hypothetical protein